MTLNRAQRSINDVDFLLKFKYSYLKQRPVSPFNSQTVVSTILYTIYTAEIEKKKGKRTLTYIQC